MIRVINMLTAQKTYQARKKSLAAKLLLIICCFITNFSVVANEITNDNTDNSATNIFELVSGENSGYYSPKETLTIVVPSNFNPPQMGNISIELDAIDITEMVELSNGQIVYNPLQAMLPENHELRITEYADNGDINELGVWYFDVRMSEAFEEYALAADTQINSRYRLSEKEGDYPLPERLQTDANSQIGFKIRNGNWQTEGQFDLNYTSIKDNRPSERTIENTEFLIKTGNQYVEAKIGHQNVGQASFIMDNFRRRGISVAGKVASLNSTITGFSLSSNDITGFGHGLGISNAQQRVHGYSLSIAPISDGPKLLNISATWLSGKGNDGNIFVSDFESFDDTNAATPVSEKGDAWSMVADSLLLEDKLRIRAEYAETEFNFNPLDELGAEKDSAETLLVTYADNTDSGVTWNAGFNYQQIGTYFKSLANRGLPSDRELSKLFAGMQWDTVGVQISGEEQKDNLENIAQLPKTTTELNSINVNWSPQLKSHNTWLGIPYFDFGYNEQSQRQNNIPLDYFFPATDNQLESWQASGSFSYNVNSWGFTLMNTNFTDKSGVQNDSGTNSINLFSNFILEEIGNISPSIQFDQSKDKVTGLTSVGVTYSLQSVFTLIPNKLDGSADIMLNKNDTNDLFTKNESMAINLAFNWRAREATSNQFGIDLALGGTYNDFEDKIFPQPNQETYQIYLNATFTLPTRIGNSD